MITTDLTTDLVRGAAELEQTPDGMRIHRLPAWVRRQYPEQTLIDRESQPAGVRIVVRTTATRIKLVSHSTHTAFRGSERPRGRIDVFVDGSLQLGDELTGGDAVEIDMAAGSMHHVAGPHHTTVVEGLAPTEKTLEFHLPHNESLELISLCSDKPLHPAPRTRPLWVHHGSSISQGSNAASPSGIWPAVAARRGGVELHNLGFGGSCFVDPFMARVIRDAPADVISVKLGINIVNLDAMRVRTLVPAIHGFLDTIREGHPTTPLVLISPIFCPIHESTSGPGTIVPESLGTSQVKFSATGTPGDESAGRLTLEVIRREMRSLVEDRADDANLYFLDGLELYGAPDEAELPLPDNLHPDSATHQLIGDRFADRVFAADGPFAAVPRH
ncbi:GDSL-type esterase/lipase family protein [Arthrobacter sp. AOP36-C1-22]|uniref:GDSL-type esterase/lipase family protein n=1 Tax=Arthrobacter sp. AOP36-C1-22 TaxID=3457683 RepID=UPI0040342639